MRIQILLLVAAAACLPAQESKPGRRWTTVQRLDRARLEAVHRARTRFAEERRPAPGRAVFEDFRAVLHVHAEDAAHTGGTRQQVLAAAHAAGVRVVIFSDHDGAHPETWRGIREGVLFVPGAEFGEKHLLQADFRDRPLRFLSHVEEQLDVACDAFDGLEIYNRHTDAKDEEEFTRYFRAAMKDPGEWRRIGSVLTEFPDEFFGAGADYWPSIFAKWDRETQRRHLTGIAANDAHHNQIYQGLDFDPYERSFRNTSTHILARELNENEIRSALAAGRVYVSHDWLADPTGFELLASNNLGVFDMGDSVPFVGNTRISVQAPVEARLKLLRNGDVVAQAESASFEFTAREPGVYRLEAWLSVDGEERPWIYSNPLYLERPSGEALRLPSAEVSPQVELVKDIVYTPGKPEDEGKHKLDLYLPRGRKSFPVFFFVHGGSWRSGDRSRYVALGNRFASEGIGTVVISYRLAPQSPHPAQIEDVAAALAWAVHHIQEYGGRPDRIVIGGHSAGAHLVALLALAPEYLKAVGIPASSIRGVAALSGPYRIRGFEEVFGTDPEVRRLAAPLERVHPGAPPFLVSYCQWDYLALPAHAKALHQALEAAGNSSQLLYLPGENHISEIVHMVREADPLGRAVLEFIRSRVQ